MFLCKSLQYTLIQMLVEVFKMIESNSCTGVSTEGQVTDILCTLPTDQCLNQSTASISWVFVSSKQRTEIADGSKYGKWM